MTELFSGYLIDTDEIINLVRRTYGQSVFPSIHQHIDELIQEGKLLSCAEVLNELRANKVPTSDPVLEWAEAHRHIFVELDEAQDQALVKIMEQFPDIVKINSNTGVDADPILIALAMSKGWKIITHERRSGANQKPKIPNVCDQFGIECLGLLEFFQENKWQV